MIKRSPRCNRLSVYQLSQYATLPYIIDILDKGYKDVLRVFLIFWADVLGFSANESSREVRLHTVTCVQMSLAPAHDFPIQRSQLT